MYFLKFQICQFGREERLPANDSEVANWRTANERKLFKSLRKYFSFQKEINVCIRVRLYFCLCPRKPVRSEKPRERSWELIRAERKL